jgi:hypothetical protein
MSSRRVVPTLAALAVLIIGVGAAIAINGAVPQPIPAPHAAQRPPVPSADQVMDELTQAQLAIQPQRPTGCAQDNAMGMIDAEARARAAELEGHQRLIDQMLATMATIPPPPGFDPANQKGVVNIHRPVCPGQDYAVAKAQGMSDEEARVYAAQMEAARLRALSTMFGTPPP